MTTHGEKFALSEADKAKGITTIDAKLDAGCQGYAILDTLFAGRQNIDPAHTAEGESENDNEDEGDYMNK